MRVLALDPGQRVGWATADTRVRGQEPAELHNIDHGIWPIRDAAMQVHDLVVVRDSIDVVIYEKWILTARGAKVLVGDDMQSSQFIGAARLCCWLNPRVQVVLQPARRDYPWRRSLTCGHPSAQDILDRLAKLPKSHDEAHDGSALQHLWDWFFERYV